MAQFINGQSMDAATTSSGLGAGAGDHLPVGDYGGMDYRSAMRFAKPAWTGWTAITSATLKVYISDHKHVGPKNSSIYCSRMNVPVWTKDQGSQDCENGFSGSNTTQYGDIASVSTDRISFSSGSTANAAKTLDVTAMVRYYQQNNSDLVFVFDNNGADQYTELWSLGKAGTTYDAVLTINYEVQSAPVAPTLSAPINGVVSGTDTPTFSWVHSDPQGDAQASAEVRVWDAAGTTQVGTTRTVAGATQSLVWPVALTRGLSYQWDVRTSDAATGFGPWSTKGTFSVKANPVVTINVNRRMVYNGAARLAVDWTSNQPQYQFRVTAPGYDSGIQTGGQQAWTLSTLGLTNGTGVSITVQVWNTDSPALTGSASRSFTPRWGLTTHRKTLAAVPVNWQSPVVNATVPAGASLVVEYGSAATVAATPTAWFSSITSVPKTQYLHWRAWFIPSASAGPTLDSIDIPYDTTIATIDQWGSSIHWPWESAGGLPANVSIDTGESVYGTRSLRFDVTGPTYNGVNGAKFKARAGRKYIISGLMRSQGASGGHFRLLSTSPVAVVADSPWMMPPLAPAGVLTDWERYKSQVWEAPADMDVCVQCVVETGTAGTTVWFDGLKVEESSVATPWNPATVGATTLDAGGVQIDRTKGGVFRYNAGVGLRQLVEGGTDGLVFGGDTELSSPVTKTLRIGPASGNDYALEVGDDATLYDVGVANSLGIKGKQTPTSGGLVFGSDKDTNLYRVSANRLKSDDTFEAAGLDSNGALVVAGNATISGTLTVTGAVNAPLPAPIRRVYTGTSTWSKPAGLRYIDVEVQAGGGGGGGTAANGSGVNNCGGCGGGGGYVRSIFTNAELSGSYTVTVGGGGGGGGGGGTGGVGTSSSFVGTNANVVATGGGGGVGMAGGSGNTGAAGGVGGGGSGGDYVITGTDGEWGRIVGGILTLYPKGGNSAMGGGTRAAGLGTTGVTGKLYGGGATGAIGTSSDVARAGGVGGAGCVVVTEYY